MMMGMVLNNFKNDFGANVKRIKDIKTFNTVWFIVYFLFIAPMIFFRHSGARAFFPVYYAQAIPIVLLAFFGVAFNMGITKTMMLVPMDEADRRKYVRDAFILKCIVCIIPMIIGGIVIAFIYPGVTPAMLLAILPYASFVIEFNMVPDYTRSAGVRSTSLPVLKIMVTAIIVIITAVDMAFVYEPIYIGCVAINTVLSVWFIIVNYPRMIRDFSIYEYSYKKRERAKR
ncbi:MAG: hypothetical protein E7241_08460 [Lachnospiraceae bacterium]|nr:hypothetical protein [Lachnospiraceae bacterium]